MINTLYSPFRKWTEKGSCYIISDTHFEDADCKLMDSKWISPEEQVERINNIVHKNDTLVILGDVGKVEWITKLKAGYKVLVCGNHDVGASHYERREYYRPDSNVYKKQEAAREQGTRYKLVNNNKIIKVDNKLFDEVYTGPLMISKKIILSHEPLPNIDWALNIHGHDHAGYFCKNHINVCCNIIDYTPVNLKEIIKNGILKHINSIHRITIDNATAHPIKKKRVNNE